LIVSPRGKNQAIGPPARAAAAAIPASTQRRPRLPQKLPSDILTLQSKGHLNLVATSGLLAKRRRQLIANKRLLHRNNLQLIRLPRRHVTALSVVWRGQAGGLEIDNQLKLCGLFERQADRPVRRAECELRNPQRACRSRLDSVRMTSGHHLLYPPIAAHRGLSGHFAFGHNRRRPSDCSPVRT
jgi:hypothetical protein